MFFEGAYFCLNMVLTTLSSFLSVTVINIYMREDKSNKVPDWLRKVRTYHFIFEFVTLLTSKDFRILYDLRMRPAKLHAFSIKQMFLM